MAYVDPLNGAISGIVLILLIVAAVWITLKLFKGVLKVVFGIIINSIIGLAAIFGFNFFLNVGIPLKVYTLLPTALFGIPAVATFLILRLFGVSL